MSRTSDLMRSISGGREIAKLECDPGTNRIKPSRTLPAFAFLGADLNRPLMAKISSFTGQTSPHVRLSLVFASPPFTIN
jgi:hypothetical protein